MSDGNMATNPQGIGSTDAVTEEDMGKVRSIFERGINALVDVSRLASQVEALQAQVTELVESISKVRRQNDWLDEQLVRIRGERDQALNDRDSATQAAMNHQLANSTLITQLDLAKVTLGEDQERITVLMREKDDAQMRSMELEDQLAKVNARIEKFLALADEIDPPQEPELAKPTVPPITPYTPENDQASTPDWGSPPTDRKSY